MKQLALRALALAIGSTALLAGVTVADAHTVPSSTHPITVVADNLNNPRQMAVLNSEVYVAEAGNGGDIDLGDGSTLGFSGAVTKIDRHNVASKFQTGVLSIGGEEGGVGLDAVAFKGSKLVGIITGSCELPPDLPPAVSAVVGHVVQLNGGTSITPIADATTPECTTNPDGQEVDTDPYGIAVNGSNIYVADAAGNDLLRVSNGAATVLKVLSTNSQPVPTSLAMGPDGALYIGTLDFEGGNGGAAVYRIDLRTGVMSVYADGLTAITGIAFGPGGKLYVSEFTTDLDTFSADGDVVSIPWGGGPNGRETIGAGDLHFPGGVAFANGGLYVSNWSTQSDTGDGPHGQVVFIAVNSPS